MKNCALCENTGKERKYFIEDQSLCDYDYIEYLEFVIDDMDEDITIESANKALSRLRISRRPELSNSLTRQHTTKRRRRR